MSRFIDLTGQKFGRLTVIEQAPKEKGKHTMWVCQCSCDKKTIKTVDGAALRNGHTKSCGCLAIENGIKKQLEEQKEKLIGKKFGHLTVLSFAGYEEKHSGKGRRTVWHCKCDCEAGNEIDVPQVMLIGGKTTSCGCARHKSPPNFEDITGQRFGELVVIEKAPSRNERTYWKCKCDCGGYHIAEAYDLKHGIVTHCADGMAHNVTVLGSKNELEIKRFVLSILPNVEINKAKHILDGKEIDIYLPEYKFGIEYNGSAFHATENGAFYDKNKYYHRDKFLLARKKGIHLITVFDIDYETNKLDIFNNISNILLNSNYEPFIPKDEIVYTNNDYDNGLWLLKYGYKEVGQEEPTYFIYNNKYKVYRCGRTIWRK